MFFRLDPVLSTTQEIALQAILWRRGQAAAAAGVPPEPLGRAGTASRSRIVPLAQRTQVIEIAVDGREAPPVGRPDFKFALYLCEQ
jgi:hypothetical protein